MNDLFDLNIWWNLRILRDPLKDGGQPIRLPLAPQARNPHKKHSELLFAIWR